MGFPGAGDLDTSVIIEQPTLTLNAIGEPIKTWKAFRHVFAKVIPTSASEFRGPQAIRSERKSLFVMRHIEGIDETMRLRTRRGVYQITGITFHGQRESIQVFADMVVNTDIWTMAPVATLALRANGPTGVTALAPITETLMPCDEVFGYAEEPTGLSSSYSAGDSVEFGVYAYKIAGNAVRFYSSGVSAPVSIPTTGWVIWLDYHAPAASDGVRILRRVNGSAWKFHDDTAGHGSYASLNDGGDAWGTWTLGSTVTPSSPYTWS